MFFPPSMNAGYEARTWVAPLSKFTIPRLELLSSLLLSKLLVTVKGALDSEISLGEPACFTDSKVALCWIKGHSKKWKQFVEHRVRTIRELVPAQHWNHCSGLKNPADLPSKGISISDLLCDPLWLTGPPWLLNPLNREEDTMTLPEECLEEMKKSAKNYFTLIAVQEKTAGIDQVISCDKFSSFSRMVRVTAVVLSFVHTLLIKVKGNTKRTVKISANIEKARVLWLQAAQSSVTKNSRFKA